MMTATNVLVAVGAILAAYLIGSINFAVIFSSLFTGKDVRKSGSGNAGTTNVMRTAGLLPGVLTFIFDAAKGFVGAFLGQQIFLNFLPDLPVFTPIYGASICYLFVMIGHIFPIFFGFKGGKGIATSVGGFAVCCWPAIVIGLVAFAISTIITKIVSVSSLIATVFVVTFAIVFHDVSIAGVAENLVPQIIMAIMAGAIVFYSHRANIGRIIKGEEKKLTIGRSKKNG